MNCGEVEKLLTVDSAVAAESDVREHIERCESCAEFNRQLAEIEELKQALVKRCEAPMGFSDKIAHHVSRRRAWSGFSTLAAVMASLLILVAAANWPKGSASSFFVAQESSKIEESLPSDLGVTVNEEVEGARSPYVEVILLEPSGDPYVVQIPSTIKIRRTDAARGTLLKVSH